MLRSESVIGQFETFVLYEEQKPGVLATWDIVRERGTLGIHHPSFSHGQGDSAIDRGGKLFSSQSENTEVGAAHDQERHAEAAGEACQGALQA
jgi:hypothetical protein